MPLKQDLGELLPPAAKDLAQHPAASCCMSAVWDGKTHGIFFRFYFECLDSAEQQGQAAGNRQAEPNCCGDWLLASLQMKELSSETSPVKSKVSPHLSYHNPEKQREQCSAIFLLNFLFSLRCFPLIFLECLTRYMLLEGTERKWVWVPPVNLCMNCKSRSRAGNPPCWGVRVWLSCTGPLLRLARTSGSAKASSRWAEGHPDHGVTAPYPLPHPLLPSSAHSSRAALEG